LCAIQIFYNNNNNNNKIITTIKIIETSAVYQVESLMEQRDELVSRGQELESTVAQLKAKDGQLNLTEVKF